MPRASRQCFILCICFLIFGVLIGISIDAAFRPNHMRFWVTEVNEIAFAPSPGDKIEWFKVGTTEPMNITFWGGDPCFESHAAPLGSVKACTIRDIPPKATYYYTCKATDDKSYVCNDPQGGPRSGTQLNSFAIRLSDLIENIDALIIQAFRAPHQTTSKPLQENSSGNISASQTNIAEMPSAKVETQAAYPTIHAQIDCVGGNGRPEVTVPYQAPDSPIQASVGQQIVWGSSTGGTFSVSMASGSMCAEGMNPPKQICTVQASGSYTVNDSSCAPTSYSSENIMTH